MILNGIIEGGIQDGESKARIQVGVHVRSMRRSTASYGAIMTHTISPELHEIMYIDSNE